MSKNAYNWIALQNYGLKFIAPNFLNDFKKKDYFWVFLNLNLKIFKLKFNFLKI